MLKISVGQNKRYKNALLFLSQAPNRRSFIRNSYTRWSTRFISLKLCVRFSIFDFVSLLEFIILLKKSMDSLNLKRHNPFQNKNNRKATLSFAPSSLIFKLQQEVWTLSDICLSWSSSQSDLEMNFLYLEN